MTPQEVGSLDRRGELVPISVAPTISVYTPFFHSSRGYGLFVDGPMEGVFDIAKTAPRSAGSALQLRAQRRQLPLLRLQRAEPRRHPRPLHRAHRAAVAAAALGVPAHALARRARLGRRPRCSTASPMNAAFVEDMTMYETLGFPAPGWYTFDRPWIVRPGRLLPGAGFTRFEFDPVRFPNAAQMIACVEARAAPRALVWGSPWACGDRNDPRDNIYDAVHDGYFAPRSACTSTSPTRRRRRGGRARCGNFISAMDIAGFKLDRGDETVPSAADRHVLRRPQRPRAAQRLPASLRRSLHTTSCRRCVRTTG